MCKKSDFIIDGVEFKLDTRDCFEGNRRGLILTGLDWNPFRLPEETLIKAAAVLKAIKTAEGTYSGGRFVCRSQDIFETHVSSDTDCKTLL